MSTPVLSKTQQRKSLSGKKGPVKGLKNVLARPYENYWPVLKNDHGAALENLLKRLLPVLKRSEIKIPWSQLRKMKKEERSAARRAAQIECDIGYDKIAVKSIVFGINAITRLVEKDDACCILLDANVDTSLLVKHIVVMAQNKSIPVILITFLKKVTLETVGFASAAIALKKHVKDSQDNYFHSLFLKVSESSSILQSIKGPVSLFQDKTLVDDETMEDQINIENIKKDIKEIKKSCVVSTDIYLYRTSKQERVFKPVNSTKEKQKRGNRWTDFIALEDDKYFADDKEVPLRFFEGATTDSDNDTAEKVLYNTSRKVMGDSDTTNEKADKKKVSYKPLKVKRLQGNECRIKATKAPKVKKK